jgi:HAD superfamily hydrolase (TIGR01458 family)
MAELLRRQGFDVAVEEILVPAVLARRRILESPRGRAALLVPEASRADFDGVDAVEDDPDWVVIGDLGRGFTFARLNRAFRWLMDGARLLALQKNRYWHAGRAGLALDAGAFVAALEFAAGVEAEVLGKPSRGFFELALQMVGLPAERVVVVGDDVLTDAAGGASAGCRSAVVRTGKFDARALARSGFTPDLLLDSIADLTPHSGNS